MGCRVRAPAQYPPPVVKGRDLISHPSHHIRESNMITKAATEAGHPKAASPLTTLPVELAAAVDEVNQRVRDCEKLDAAIDACPGERERIAREIGNLESQLAESETVLALSTRGSDREGQTIATVEKLGVSLASAERERKRMDLREASLEREGPGLDDALAKAVAGLRLEAGGFSDPPGETLAGHELPGFPRLRAAPPPGPWTSGGEAWVEPYTVRGEGSG